MRTKVWLLTLLTMALLCSPALAGYEGILTANEWHSATTTGDSWHSDDATNTNFWNFYVAEDSTVNFIIGHRIDAGLDLVFSLFSGTTDDYSSFSSESDFSTLTYLGTADDEIIISGPYGDPYMTGTLLGELTAGWYTIAAGGYLSSSDGPYDYEILLAGDNLASTPIPGAALLLGTGLFGLLGIRRRANS